MTTVPITVAARNEARSIGACLDSLAAAIRYAEARLPVSFELLVVCDRCTDATESIVHTRGVATLSIGEPGGKIAAQRAGLRPGPFQIFCDADVTMSEETLLALCLALLENIDAQAAMPPRAPLAPRANSLLARALHLYNKRRGFSSQRTWLSGRLFAIRKWRFPSREEVAARAKSLPADPFYAYEDGLRADDIFLSRTLIAEHGPSSIVETRAGLLYFRAPETLCGMYRYYRRMRMELERLDALFPETTPAHRRHGTRRPDLLAAAPMKERALYIVFECALLLCRAAYVSERAWRRFAGLKWEPWPAIEETKVP